MADEIVFYTHPMSRGRTVRWMLEELGQPYRTEILEYGSSMKAPAYLAINPMGKVPALTHGTAVVTETAAICAYLADAFPAARLAPQAGSRAAYYRWMFFAAGPLEAACIDTAAGLSMPEDKQAMAGYGTMQLALDSLETELARRHGPYLAGDAFSAADLVMAALLGWTMQFGVLEKRPAFEAYANPLLARPAALEAKRIDDALLAAQA